MSVDTIGYDYRSIKSFPFTLAGGVASSAVSGFTAGSQPVSIVRTALGGAPGYPGVKYQGPLVTFTGDPVSAVTTSPPQLVVYSTSATDTSTYAVYWVDMVQPSGFSP
jgi:hypothetical protein